jgi:diguanylate cyclase (GGDEF)-like protein/PAS domain S-box-containing protein
MVSVTKLVPQKPVGNLIQDAPRHNRDLLLVLNRAAQSVQRARTEKDVYRIVGNQIKSLGENVSLYVYAEDHKALTLVHTSHAPNVIRRVEKLLGSQAIGYHIVFPANTVYARSLKTGRTEYIQWTREHVSRTLAEPLRPLTEQLMDILKIKHGILAPLYVDGESQGLLVISGESLTESDVPIVGSFAAQISLSLRNMRLTQQLQSELHARSQMEENAILQSAALEAAANAIAITDTGGIIQWVNSAWVKLTGYTKEESIGKHTRIIKSGNHAPQFYKEMWEMILAGKVWRGELKNRRKDGSLYDEEQTITPVMNSQGDVTHFIAIKLDITERKRAQSDLERLARTDALTGVFNRRYLLELAGHEFDVARRYEQPLAVIMFDLDHFKHVNDTFGHTLGDRVLQYMTQAARSQLREVDLFGRYGGEEFVIISPMTEAYQSRLLAERIRSKVESMHVETEKGNISITLSAGVAEMLHDPLDASIEDIIHRADEALYVAKQNGRNCTVIFDSDAAGAA